MSSFNNTFLNSCWGKPVSYTPVWFMRQAGRYMPEYQAIRKKYSLLEIARTPELATQVTLQPVEILGVDAAILFADILLPLAPMGIGFSFQKGEGPVIDNPVRNESDINHLKTFDAQEELSFVCKAVEMLSQELKDRIPLIGFAGGPFTLASYMTEGGHSRHYGFCKGLMHQHPKDWHRFLEKIAQVTLSYLSAQIKSGVQAVQLFDSWIGVLSPQDYKTYVLPHSHFILKNLSEKFPEIPRIHFGTGSSMLLSFMKEAGAEVIGIDWQTPLSYARKVLGEKVSLQGNLDPALLFAPQESIQKEIKNILEQRGNPARHIFNLGHGILPQTPVENVKFVVKEVHRLTQTNSP